MGEGLSSGTIALVALGSLVFLVVFYYILIKYVVGGQNEDQRRPEDRDEADRD